MQWKLMQQVSHKGLWHKSTWLKMKVFNLNWNERGEDSKSDIRRIYSPLRLFWKVWMHEKMLCLRDEEINSLESDQEWTTTTASVVTGY